MRLWTVRRDKMCIFSSHQSVFLLSNLTDPSSTLSTQHTEFWKRVSCTSKTIPITSALHMCVCVCVCWTGSGLNYLEGFNWMSSPYSPVCVTGSKIFVVYMRAWGRQAHKTDSSCSQRCVNSACLPAGSICNLLMQLQTGYTTKTSCEVPRVLRILLAESRHSDVHKYSERAFQFKFNTVCD